LLWLKKINDFSIVEQRISLGSIGYVVVLLTVSDGGRFISKDTVGLCTTEPLSVTHQTDL
jgi:hypothetical protein